MLSSNNNYDIKKMMNYYRTSEMLNLKTFFPNISPIKDIVIVENEKEYFNNKEYLETFDQNDIDTPKGIKPITGIQNSGKSDKFYNFI